MIFDFEQYIVDVDVPKTRDFHEKNAEAEGCSCPGCRNFCKAVENIEDSVTSFLQTLGLDPKNIDDLTPHFIDRDSNLMSYCGVYHLCGQVVGGSAWPKRTPEEYEAWRKTPGNGLYNDPHVLYLTRNFRVTFSNETWLLADDFPTPACSLEISAELPWILDQEEAEAYYT